MSGIDPYGDFTTRLKLFASKRPDVITTTLGDIFTMRLIGNKTHGDLAETRRHPKGNRSPARI